MSYEFSLFFFPLGAKLTLRFNTAVGCNASGAKDCNQGVFLRGFLNITTINSHVTVGGSAVMGKLISVYGFLFVVLPWKPVLHFISRRSLCSL
jgi:hypothetical protein